MSKNFGDFIPFQHQEKILERNPAKHLLAFDTGTGKTLTSLALARKNGQTARYNSPALVIVPKALKEQWAENEMVVEDGHFILTKEEFKRAVINQDEDLPKVNCVIVDEAHYFSGPKSQMSKALKWYTKYYKPQYVWLLTATPYLSTPWNIHTLAGHLGVHWHYRKFKEHFFYEVPMGGRMVPMLKPNMEKDVAYLVSQIGTAVDMREVVDELPEQMHHIERCEASKEQRMVYNTLLNSEFANITLWTKTHQIENEVLNGDGYTPDQMIGPHSYQQSGKTKLAKVLQYIQQADKVAIVARYNLQLDMYEKVITTHSPNIKVFRIDGSVKDRHDIVQRVEDSERCVVLIQAQCSEGYELPSVGLCVFASMSFSFKDYKQMLGRFLRINKLKENKYVYLISDSLLPEELPATKRRVVDWDVYQSIKNKQDFSFEIYNA